jgi:phenylacetate-CoA ligase
MTLKKIPFTVKDDLKENYPYGMVAAKPEEIVEIHASSGTTGSPIVGAYTKNDLDIWQEIMARSLYTTGGRPQDVIHIAYGYGLFTGGFVSLWRTKTWYPYCANWRGYDTTPNNPHEGP